MVSAVEVQFKVLPISVKPHRNTDACHSIGNICVGSNEQSFIRKQLAADAGAVNAIAAAMQTHFLSSAVQEYGCFALGNICFGFDVKANARKVSTVAARTLAVCRSLAVHLPFF